MRKLSGRVKRHFHRLADQPTPIKRRLRLDRHVFLAAEMRRR